MLSFALTTRLAWLTNLTRILIFFVTNAYRLLPCTKVLAILSKDPYLTQACPPYAVLRTPPSDTSPHRTCTTYNQTPYKILRCPWTGPYCASKSAVARALTPETGLSSRNSGSRAQTWKSLWHGSWNLSFPCPLFGGCPSSSSFLARAYAQRILLATFLPGSIGLCNWVAAQVFGFGVRVCWFIGYRSAVG